MMGWTLTLHTRSASLLDGFAMLGVPAGQDTKTTLVACVGMDSAARGRGLRTRDGGSGMEQLRESGIESTCVNWIVLVD